MEKGEKKNIKSEDDTNHIKTRGWFVIDKMIRNNQFFFKYSFHITKRDRKKYIKFYIIQ